MDRHHGGTGTGDGACLNVTPSAITLDALYHRAGNVKGMSKKPLRHNALAGTNDYDLLVSQFGKPVVFASFSLPKPQAICVKGVLTPRAVFEVAQAVIAGVPIKMVDFLSNRARSNEGFYYEFCNLVRALISLPAKRDGTTAISAHQGLQCPASERRLCGTTSANPTMIRDFVPSFPSENGAPLLRVGIHPFSGSRANPSGLDTFVERMLAVHGGSIA